MLGVLVAAGVLATTDAAGVSAVLLTAGVPVLVETLVLVGTLVSVATVGLPEGATPVCVVGPVVVIAVPDADAFRLVADNDDGHGRNLRRQGLTHILDDRRAPTAAAYRQGFAGCRHWHSGRT